MKKKTKRRDMPRSIRGISNETMGLLHYYAQLKDMGIGDVINYLAANHLSTPSTCVDEKEQTYVTSQG